MLAEEAKRVLKSAGYESEEIEVNKNGCNYTGIRIINGTDINPIIYVDDIDDGDSLLDAVVYAQNYETPDISFDPETVYSNVRIGIAKEVAPEIIRRKTKYHGMVVYLYVRFSDATAKLPRQILNNNGFTERKLWDKARKNTFANTRIMPFMIPGAFIVTNEEMTYGASSILDTATLKKKVNKGEYFVCPSSIHEMLLIPTGSHTLEEINEIVKQVNDTTVDPHEQLADKAFVIEV